VIDESDKKANYLLRFCQPITDTISFIFKYIDPTDEEELINCACSTVSLTVHLWGGEGCQNLFESVNLAKINVLLEHVTKRNQRLLLKSIRKGIQVHTCLDQLRTESDLIAKIIQLSKSRSRESLSLSRSIMGESKDLQSLATEIIEKLNA